MKRALTYYIVDPYTANSQIPSYNQALCVLAQCLLDDSSSEIVTIWVLFMQNFAKKEKKKEKKEKKEEERDRHNFFEGFYQLKWVFIPVFSKAMLHYL